MSHIILKVLKNQKVNSFVLGVGSVFNFSGLNYPFGFHQHIHNNSNEAIKNVWESVGNCFKMQDPKFKELLANYEDKTKCVGKG
ncbi:MAG: hypothetical protein IPP06_04155 [Saprospiraceae bacterium]|nr:hypothetical protein [Candidatus Vicinibacter affinis]